jgi:VanZ family protein
MIAIMGMIFFLSHQPGDFADLPEFIGLDKLIHVIVYACLAASFLYGLQPFINTTTMPVAGMVVVLFCLLYGLSDEFHQSFISGRFVSGWDVLADTSGAVLVVLWWMRREGQGERQKAKGERF